MRFFKYYFLVVDEQKELQLEVERLKQIVQKQREELRSVEKDLDQKHTTTEMVSALLEFCSGMKICFELFTVQIDTIWIS